MLLSNKASWSHGTDNQDSKIYDTNKQKLILFRGYD